MIIGYDGKRAVLNNTGLGNYSRLLVEVLSERYPLNDYLLYTPRLKANTRLATLHERENVRIHTPESVFGRLLPSLWRVRGVTEQLKHDKVQLYHGLSGELPLNIAQSGISSVVTIHDLIFLRHPQWYKPVDREIYNYKFKRAACNADRIIAISECTKRDIMEFYDVPAEKIDVVYQGCAPQFHRIPTEKEVEEVRRKYGLMRPYILCVGTIEERKNQLQPVRGLRGLASDLDVVLVGRRTPYVKVLDEYTRTYHTEERLKILDNVEFVDLPALYAGAFCSSYTSEYEGFGIPVIESLSVGCPVVVATGSCLEEAGGPLTPAVSPYDVEAWLNTVKELITFPASRNRIAQAGRKYVQRFNYEAMAQGTMECYKKAMEEKHQQ